MACRGRPKKKSPIKEKFITIRITKKSYIRIKWLADEYANGNISKWVEHGALTGQRRYFRK